MAAGMAAVAGGLLIGVVDLHANEAIVTLAFLLALNMVLGAMAPRKGWYWPFLSSVGVPFMNLFPRWALTVENPNLPRTVLSYAALSGMMLVAAMAGMLFGVIVRRSAEISRRSPSAGPFV